MESINKGLYDVYLLKKIALETAAHVKPPFFANSEEEK